MKQSDQATDQGAAPQETLSEFVADEGGTETTDANTMLVAAYMAFWLVVFALVALSWKRQRGLADRLSRLERALDADAVQGESEVPGAAPKKALEDG